MTQCSNISEFAVDIADVSLEDLRSRLNNARWPEPEPVDDWSMGTPLGYLQSLCQYWANEYDGQRIATRLNQWPQFVFFFVHLGGSDLGKTSPERVSILSRTRPKLVLNSSYTCSNLF